MRKIITLLSQKKKQRSQVESVDEKTIFYVFTDVIRTEFGEQGVRRFTPTYLSGKTLIVAANDHQWGSELWTQRVRIAEKINARIGQQAIILLKVVYEGGRARS